MKNLLILFILFATINFGYSQNDLEIEGSNPRIITKINSTYGGLYLKYGSIVQGGLLYTDVDNTIRLSQTINPETNIGLTLKTQGTHAGHFGFGMTPSQHFVSIKTNSYRQAGVVNHPLNKAHLSIVETGENSFGRIWFLNENNTDRWALLGRTGVLNNDMTFAFNGDNKLRMNSAGFLTLNNVWTLPNADGTAGQALITDGSGNVGWGSAGASSELSDADSDTKITVEETPDSDNINLYCENSLMINMKKDTMYIPQGVFSGYGTLNPLDPIHITVEDTDQYGGLYLEGGSGTKHVHTILDNRTANGRRYSLVSVGDDSSIPNGSFAVRDITGGGVERLLIDPSGNVGVGVNFPTAKLHVNGAGKIEGALEVTDTLLVGSGIGAKLYIGNDYITDGGANLLRTDASFTPTTTDLYNLGAGGSKWKNLFLSNHVNINTNIISSDGSDILRTDANWSPTVNNSKNLGDATFKWKNIFLSGGIVLGSHQIGQTGSSITVNTQFKPSANNVHKLGGASFRWTEIYATNGTINTSDKRAKTNISSMRYGLKEILKLRPVNFDWKENIQEKKTLGLIAQELLKVIPEVVVVPDNTEELLGVKYADLIPVLIKAIQDQQLIIDGKAVEIDVLNNKMSKIEGQLSSILNKLELGQIVK